MVLTFVQVYIVSIGHRKAKVSVADLEISWEYIVYVLPSLAIQRLLAFQCWMLPSAWHVVDSLEMNYRGKVK